MGDGFEKGKGQVQEQKMKQERQHQEQQPEFESDGTGRIIFKAWPNPWFKVCPRNSHGLGFRMNYAMVQR